jgi:serine/threonine protein kinase
VHKDDFEILAVVGRGSYGKVYQVQHSRDGKIYAMKSIKKGVVVEADQIEGIKGNSLPSWPYLVLAEREIL